MDSLSQIVLGGAVAAAIAPAAHRRAALAAASATLVAPALAQGMPELRSIRATCRS